MDCRRTNYLLRQFCDLVAWRIETGELTARRAAELLRDRMVPLHVALRMIGRAA